MFQSMDPSAIVPGRLSNSRLYMEITRRYRAEFSVQNLESQSRCWTIVAVENILTADYGSIVKKMTIRRDGPLLARRPSDPSVLFRLQGTV